MISMQRGIRIGSGHPIFEETLYMPAPLAGQRWEYMVQK